MHPLLRALTAAPTVLLLLAACVGGWFVLFGGLLIEPVDMAAVGPCAPDDPAGCVRIHCRFRNQGPVPTRGDVLLDVWTDDGDDTYLERIVPARVRVPLRLSAGEAADLVYDIPTVRHVPGKTMVRCMPWYAGGRSRPGNEAIAARPVP